MKVSPGGSLVQNVQRGGKGVKAGANGANGAKASAKGAKAGAKVTSSLHPWTFSPAFAPSAPLKWFYIDVASLKAKSHMMAFS